MRTEAIFELRRQLPDLSDGAFILLAFIAFRVDGSRFVDDAGAKYIFLSGNNDPAVALGWTNGKVKRMKKELRAAGLISTIRVGFAQPYRTYLNLSYGSNLNRMKSEPDEKSAGSKTTLHRGQKRPLIGPKSAPYASYIRKTKRKDQEERPRGTASPPCPAGVQPDLWEAYQEALRKEREQNEQHGSDGDDDLPTEIL